MHFSRFLLAKRFFPLYLCSRNQIHLQGFRIRRSTIQSIRCRTEIQYFANSKTTYRETRRKTSIPIISLRLQLWQRKELWSKNSNIVLRDTVPWAMVWCAKCSTINSEHLRRKTNPSPELTLSLPNPGKLRIHYCGCLITDTNWRRRFYKSFLFFYPVSEVLFIFLRDRNL